MVYWYTEDHVVQSERRRIQGEEFPMSAEGQCEGSVQWVSLPDSMI